MYVSPSCFEFSARVPQGDNYLQILSAIFGLQDILQVLNLRFVCGNGKGSTFCILCRLMFAGRYKILRFGANPQRISNINTHKNSHLKVLMTSVMNRSVLVQEWYITQPTNDEGQGWSGDNVLSRVSTSLLYVGTWRTSTPHHTTWTLLDVHVCQY